MFDQSSESIKRTLISHVQPVFRKKPVLFAYLYGSFATGIVHRCDCTQLCLTKESAMVLLEKITRKFLQLDEYFANALISKRIRYEIH